MGIDRMIAVFDWRLIQNGGAGSIPTSCIHLYSFRAMSCKYHWISIGDSCFSDLFSSWAVVNLRSRGSTQGKRGPNGSRYLSQPAGQRSRAGGNCHAKVGHLEGSDWDEAIWSPKTEPWTPLGQLRKMFLYVNIHVPKANFASLHQRIQEKERKHRCNGDFSLPGSVVHPSWECFYCWRWGWVGSQGRWFGDFWKSYQKSSHPGVDHLDDNLGSPILSI